MPRKINKILGEGETRGTGGQRLLSFISASHARGRYTMPSLTVTVPSCVPFVELHLSLPSRVAAISPLVDRLMRFIQLVIGKTRDSSESEGDIELALHEALANAVRHGNQENPRKQVHVSCRCSRDGEVLVTVRDEGEGFDSEALPDPTAPQNCLRTHGRGLYLMRVLMDEVSFAERGRVVHMRKRLQRLVNR